MTLSNGALALHLGKIDESLVRSQDFYLCIRSSASNVAPALHACWRATSVHDHQIVYRELDPRKDPITPLHIEMLAGEELPHLLQTLLVGVEHAICRIPLDELTFPPLARLQHSDDYYDLSANYLIDDKNGNKRAADCNLKRRELISKNNSINKKYAAVKRITCNGNGTVAYNDNESEPRHDDETAAAVVVSGQESVDSTNDASNGNDHSLTSGAITSTLPLFCLGGSFPHIDSDEESGDDAKKIQSGESSLFSSYLFD